MTNSGSPSSLRRWSSFHTHSHFSTVDGMSKVPEMVAKAARMGYPALGLTDHGNMAGSTQLYKECRKHGILPYTGVEGYLIDPEDSTSLDDKKAGKVGRYHLGLLALDNEGYRALVKFVSMTHTRPRFNRFPRFTLDDLIDLGDNHGEHLALTSGCFFGWAQQSLVNKGIQGLKGVLETYATHFPHTFAEIQHHNIDHSQQTGDAAAQWDDDSIVEAIVATADRLGLPVLATQDSHYLNQTEKPAHALMKRMVYQGADDEFPGDSFHLATEEWVSEHYSEKVWEKVLDSCEHLYGLHDLELPPLDNYRPRVPKVSDSANDDLIDLCNTGWYERFESPEPPDTSYEDRLAYELDVIKQLDMANYFLHVHDYAKWCRDQHICIEARGSSNGSLVCFLLGITSVDPVKWNVSFDRFLSTDRIKPPDIDMDVEDVSRDSIIQYLRSKHETVRIGTFGKLGAREEDDKGSVVVTYQSYRARELEALAREAKDAGNTAEEERLMRKRGWVYKAITTTQSIKEHYPKDYKPLKRMVDMDSVHRSYGVHAAGVLLSGDDLAINDYIPSMLVASSNTTVSMFDMDDVEEWGLLKDDILGQKTLTVMRRCQELIGEDDPTDFSWIPDDDPAACKELRSGRTNTGVFHFEGYTKAKGGREMKIQNMRDVIHAQALFMPGAMESGEKDRYIARRRSAAERKAITYLGPMFEDALKDTHGTVIFQEQVMQILRGLGMDIPSINKFLKVVKDSGKGSAGRNAQRLAETREQFNEHCGEHGINQDAAWDQIAGMAAYGFNQAHATGYGIRAYRCAYLKTYYPLEFMTALLECWAGNEKKERDYVTEARRIKIRVLPPDVNTSGAVWTIDTQRKAIRKGLLAIKGIGAKCAENIAENAPYKDLEDLATRCDKRAVTGAKKYLEDGEVTARLDDLRRAGALRSIGIA